MATDPVNEIASTSGCSTSACPTSWPVPCTTLNTPGGSPASIATSAISTAAIGVCSAGLRTTELPAASAAATKAKTAVGPFHGMIKPTTPMGSRTCETLNSLGTAGIEPCSFEGHPLKYSMPSTANCTMKPVYDRSSPASSTSISANSSPRSATRAAMLRSTFSFAIGGWLRQRPSSKAIARGTCRTIHIVASTRCGFGDDNPGRRVDDVHRRTVARAKTFAVDDVTEDVVLDCLSCLGRRLVRR